MPQDDSGGRDDDDDFDDDLEGTSVPEGAPPDKPPSFAAKMLGDIARRALTTGIGSALMSDDALKSTLTEMKLPKEAMAYVMGQADKTKREIVAAIARETRDFLRGVEVDELVSRVLAGTVIEIETKVRILPREGGGVGFKTEGTKVRTARDDSAKGHTGKRRRRRRDEGGAEESTEHQAARGTADAADDRKSTDDDA